MKLMEAKDIKIMYKAWFHEEMKDKWISNRETAYEAWLERKLYDSQNKSQKGMLENKNGNKSYIIKECKNCGSTNINHTFSYDNEKCEDCGWLQSFDPKNK